jgi:hypothetical protein
VLSSSILTLTGCSPKQTLAVGESVSCLGTYTVQQTNIETGQLVVSASASSTTLPVGQQVVHTMDWVVPVDINPQLAVDIVAESCTQSGDASESLLLDCLLSQCAASVVYPRWPTMHMREQHSLDNPTGADVTTCDPTHTAVDAVLLPLLLAVKLVTCPVHVSNAGNLELRDIAIEGHASAVVHTCARTLLVPADGYNCTVTK